MRDTHHEDAAPLILYGAEISYYTGKVRAYLRCLGLPFSEVPADRSVYKSVILPRVGWPVIPVVVTDDDRTLQDSSAIIDALDAHVARWSVFPTTPRQRVLALLLEAYGDEWLKLPAMHYRWNHNTEWIIGEFGRLSRPDLDPAAQRAVGEQACRPFRGSLPALGVTEATASAIETSYEGLLVELDAHFTEHAFLFGDRPSIADFGLIGPLYAHQYRDPASGALMRRLAPQVAAWVQRVHQPEAPAALAAAGFLADDSVPDSLLPVLERLVREWLPVLSNAAERLNAWVADSPEDPVPRTLGSQPFELEGVQATRMVFPFELWMVQRAADARRALPVAERRALDDWLEPLGLLPILTLEHPRLTRRNFQLTLEGAGS
ncbi:MAG: glutathione S-transferase [Pseudomonadota bacterium]